MVEYECYADIEIGLITTSLGKLKRKKIKKLLIKTLKEYLDNDDNISDHDIFISGNYDYEVLE